MNTAIPQHVAIILDGNGRWAKKRLLPRNFGHRQGAKNVERICKDAYHLGVKYLTVYAFSTENWKRPEDEVDALMELLKRYLKSYRKKAMDNNMRVIIIGDRTGLREDIQESIREVEELTAGNTGLSFQIALNYGGRDEIVRAARLLAKQVAAGERTPESIDESALASCLDTRDIPDPDLIIRTSGEQRLSNFMTWQSAYSEFYFTDVLWPDFDREELKKALDYYASRDRRFGGV